MGQNYSGDVVVSIDKTLYIFNHKCLVRTPDEKIEVNVDGMYIDDLESIFTGKSGKLTKGVETEFSVSMNIKQSGGAKYNSTNSKLKIRVIMAAPLCISP